MLFPQMAMQLPHQEHECPHQSQSPALYNKYGDPRGGLSKQVERVVVQHDDVNDRMGLAS